jgi:hypothetical protein
MSLQFSGLCEALSFLLNTKANKKKDRAAQPLANQPDFSIA